MATIQQVEAKIDSHVDICAVRYEGIETQMRAVHARLKRIEQIGTGGDLYERPQNLFVAYFIGTPSINLFDVAIQSEADGLYAVHSSLRVRLPAAAQASLQPTGPWYAR